MTQPLTDAINALTRYANETTGQSDTNLSDAVRTLCDGYGGGDDFTRKTIMALGVKAFKNCALPETLLFPNVTNAMEQSLNMVTGIRIIVLPKIATLGPYAFSDSPTGYEVIDLGSNFSTISNWQFSDDRKLKTLLLRSSAMIALMNVNAFNKTPFASGGTGGTLYVPQDLISSYQSASNWSTILGYANNQILSIEGSIYETQYADGTPIE